MNANEIGTEAGRIFTYILPPNWILRSQEDQDDHGIDGEIEVKDDNGKALGKNHLFKVQIKGELNPTFINSNRALSFNIKLEKVRYYLEFKIPVILVVVDVSTEAVYWRSISDCEELRNQIKNQSTESMQIHIPSENKLEKKGVVSQQRLLETVYKSWESLIYVGLKDSVNRINISDVDGSSLNKRIDDCESALFSMYHKKLDGLLKSFNYEELYKLAPEVIRTELAPLESRFQAALYLERALIEAPLSAVKREQMEYRLNLCDQILYFSRKAKNETYRAIAIGKTRFTIFAFLVDQLYASHNTQLAFNKDSIEWYFHNQGVHEQFILLCNMLGKIITWINRLVIKERFELVSEIFVEMYPYIHMFRKVHEARSDEVAIDFLANWIEAIFDISFNCSLILKDDYKLTKLYWFKKRTDGENSDHYRKLVVENHNDIIELLDNIDLEVERDSEIDDFYDLSVERQKEYYLNLAKSLGLDPDDPKNEYGRIVSIGLKNYSPQSIMKNCEHLFVDYRPGGILAQQLQIHSVGGMHLLTCLKHGYACATGNLLEPLYDTESEQDVLQGLKQKHCSDCSDCSPRDDDWEWSLRWHSFEREKHQEYLDKFKI